MAQASPTIEGACGYDNEAVYGAFNVVTFIERAGRLFWSDAAERRYLKTQQTMNRANMMQRQDAPNVHVAADVLWILHSTESDTVSAMLQNFFEAMALHPAFAASSQEGLFSDFVAASIKY